MKLSKKHNQGFSLVEVAIAMTVAGFMIIALFNLQGMLFKVSTSNVRVFDQIVAMKNFFYTIMRKPPLEVNHPETEPVDGDTVQYVLKELSPTSALKKIENLSRVEIEYKALRSQKLISFLYYSQEEEKPEAPA